jgi:PAS domain S-box-containing protein
LLTAVVKSSDHAIIVADLDGMIVSGNPAAERMLGFTRADMAAKSVAMFVSPELQDGQRRIFVSVNNGERAHHADGNIP